MARYYEPGTNNPLYQHKTDTVNEEGYGLYLWDNDGSTVSGGWNYTLVDIDGLSRQYENISALTPEEARSRYARMKNAPPSRPDIDPEAVEKLIEALDGRGAWIEDISVHDSTLVMLQDRPNKTIKGISTGRFRSHMRLLLDYLRMKEEIRTCRYASSFRGAFLVGWPADFIRSFFEIDPLVAKNHPDI